MTTPENKEIVTIDTYSQLALREEAVLHLQNVVNTSKGALDTDIVDAKTLKFVKDARIKIRDTRTGIKNGRLAYTEDMTKKTKDAIEAEKYLISIISPTEDALKAKEEEYETMIENEKKRKEHEQLIISQERWNKLDTIGAKYLPREVAEMSDEGFLLFYDMHLERYNQRMREEKAEADAKKIVDDENARIANELAEEMKKEQEEIKKQTIENNRISQDNARIAQELDDKKKAIDDKENQIKLDEQRQNDIKEAKETAIIEEKARMDKETAEKEEKAKKEKEFMEKADKYREWLANNGFKEEIKDEFTTIISKEKVVLYKKVSTFWIIEPENV